MVVFTGGLFHACINVVDGIHVKRAAGVGVDTVVVVAVVGVIVQPLNAVRAGVHTGTPLGADAWVERVGEVRVCEGVRVCRYLIGWVSADWLMPRLRGGGVLGCIVMLIGCVR